MNRRTFFQSMIAGGALFAAPTLAGFAQQTGARARTETDNVAAYHPWPGQNG